MYRDQNSPGEATEVKAQGREMARRSECENATAGGRKEGGRVVGKVGRFENTFHFNTHNKYSAGTKYVYL